MDCSEQKLTDLDKELEKNTKTFEELNKNISQLTGEISGIQQEIERVNNNDAASSGLAEIAIEKAKNEEKEWVEEGKRLQREEEKIKQIAKEAIEKAKNQENEWVEEGKRLQREEEKRKQNAKEKRHELNEKLEGVNIRLNTLTDGKTEISGNIERTRRDIEKQKRICKEQEQAAANAQAADKAIASDTSCNLRDFPKWEKIYSKKNGKVYYYNETTGKKSWECPEKDERAAQAAANAQAAAKAITSDTSCNLSDFPNWKKIYSKEYGKVYYYNETTRKQSWECPEKEERAAQAAANAHAADKAITSDTSCNLSDFPKWKKIYSKPDGKVYYYNETTGKKSLECPEKDERAAKAAANAQAAAKAANAISRDTCNVNESDGWIKKYSKTKDVVYYVKINSDPNDPITAWKCPLPPCVPAEGWSEAVSEGKKYYYTASGKTSWECPTEPERTKTPTPPEPAKTPSPTTPEQSTATPSDQILKSSLAAYVKKSKNAGWRTAGAHLSIQEATQIEWNTVKIENAEITTKINGIKPYEKYFSYNDNYYVVENPSDNMALLYIYKDDISTLRDEKNKTYTVRKVIQQGGRRKRTRRAKRKGRKTRSRR